MIYILRSFPGNGVCPWNIDFCARLHFVSIFLWWLTLFYILGFSVSKVFFFQLSWRSQSDSTAQFLKSWKIKISSNFESKNNAQRNDVQLPLFQKLSEKLSNQTAKLKKSVFNKANPEIFGLFRSEFGLFISWIILSWINKF